MFQWILKIRWLLKRRSFYTFLISHSKSSFPSRFQRIREEHKLFKWYRPFVPRQIIPKRRNPFVKWEWKKGGGVGWWEKRALRTFFPLGEFFFHWVCVREFCERKKKNSQRKQKKKNISLGGRGGKSWFMRKQKHKQVFEIMKINFKPTWIKVFARESSSVT